jgi:glycerol-3-phosphate acyltransferase PlsY
VIGFWPAGALTFILDVVKGALPVFLISLPVVQSFWGNWWESVGRSGVEITDNVIWFTGFCSVLGHCFSPWVRFKGGKGVATGFGVILILTPFAAIGGILAFAFTFFKTKLGSLSSIAGLSMAAIVHLVIRDHESYKPHLWIGAAILFLILVRHEPNIDSLLEGRERSFR